MHIIGILLEIDEIKICTAILDVDTVAFISSILAGNKKCNFLPSFTFNHHNAQNRSNTTQ